MYTPDPLRLSFSGLNLTANGWDAYILNVTSGTWLTEAETTCHVWTHQVLVVVPWKLSADWAPDNAGLWITGGHSDPGIPKVLSEDVLAGEFACTPCDECVCVTSRLPTSPFLSSRVGGFKNRHYYCRHLSSAE